MALETTAHQVRHLLFFLLFFSSSSPTSTSRVGVGGGAGAGGRRSRREEEQEEGEQEASFFHPPPRPTSLVPTDGTSGSATKPSYSENPSEILHISLTSLKATVSNRKKSKGILKNPRSSLARNLKESGKDLNPITPWNISNIPRIEQETKRIPKIRLRFIGWSSSRVQVALWCPVETT